MKNNKNKQISISIAILLLVLFFTQVCMASLEYRLSKGQTVYVPVYSNVFSSPKKVEFNLATMLSIRNTNISNPITISSVDYYNTKGELIKKLYDRPVTLAPLESTYLYSPETDKSGGFGANFIVKWNAEKEVNVPIIECVMIGASSGQGISFVSIGQVIKEEN
ncbi:MAG: DUF3124 domain-containing protein [Desulfobacterales bacterium]|nr:DUF3124 domain-containing protein [Desulfobacterales bacterium]